MVTPPLENEYLMVYAEDIVITRNNVAILSQLKKHLCNHFQDQGFW